MTNPTPPAAASVPEGVTDQLAAECGEEYFFVRGMSWDKESMRAAITYALAAQPAPGVGGVIETLRSIAEGNLGDGPGQANYKRIREVSAAALLSTRPAESVTQGGEVGERINILRRICVRGRNYFLGKEDSTGIDLFEHMETEVGWLASAISATPTPATGSGEDVEVYKALDYINSNCPGWVLYAMHRYGSSIHNVNASDER